MSFSDRDGYQVFRCMVSDFLEHFQNSLSSGEPELDKEEVKVSSSECEQSVFSNGRRIPRTFFKLAGGDVNVLKTQRRSNT